MLPPGLQVRAVSEPLPGSQNYFASRPGGPDSPRLGRLGGKRSRKRRNVRRTKSRRR